MPGALPIAPRPHSDELISSWLARIAACYEVSITELRQELSPDSPGTKVRADVGWKGSEANSAAQRLRVDQDAIMRLNLKRRWPWLVTAWLPRTDGKGRARGELDLAWCHVCLAEGHATGGAYLDAEAALPLIFCHRHGTWRQDFCRRCQPHHEPRFSWRSRIEFTCADCGVPLRTNYWSGPRPASDCGSEEVSGALNLLVAFDGELRKALLRRSASLTGIGQVSARQFLAVLDGLTRALLAPDINRTSRINLFNSPLLPNMPNHEPQTWEEQPFHELSPAYRAHVSSAVIGLLSDEPVSRLMSGVRPAYKWQSLEWLLSTTPKWVQAMLIQNCKDWPAPLRVRVGLHHSRTGLDVADILAQFLAWLAEEEQRQRERVSLIG
ncbi:MULTISPECIES: TniQ family protein [Sphingomonadales]|uniref:TniQ family protein n=1 Tax=Sphingobium naphthae TaxID=1886786 RepID=A0ABU4A0D5_9SPHN|nr:TniQ family protein [Sphingobium naphthae]